MAIPRKTRTAPAGKRAAARRPALQVAPPERQFWTCSGLILADLGALRKAFERGLSDEEYRYHANREKNDFSTWVEEVLGDRACAQALRRAKDKAAAAKAVAAALTRYA